MVGIVVGVDASAPSRWALRWALNRARHGTTPLVALHVWDTPVETDLDLDAATAGALWDASTGGPVRVSVRRGRPAGRLLEAAREADLLVVGGRRHGLLQSHLGSVPVTCLQHSEAPVAVVTSPESPSAYGLVVVGVDLDPATAPALLWAAREAVCLGAVLHVVHAWQVTPHSGRDVLHPGSLRVAQAGQALARTHAWVEQVLAARPQPPVTVSAARGGPLDALVVASATADLLVLGARHHQALTRPRLGMGGQTAFLAACPTVVVPHAVGERRARDAHPG